MTDFPTDPQGPNGAVLRLHARYDGGIPKPLRVRARAGGTACLVRLKAEARRCLFDSLARDAVRALSARRFRIKTGGPAINEIADDSNLGALACDLRFYRDQGVANAND